jgi:superoxide dismutase
MHLRLECARPLVRNTVPAVLRDNPLQTAVVTQPGIPILCIDMWEHSHYLKYVLNLQLLVGRLHIVCAC